MPHRVIASPSFAGTAPPALLVAHQGGWDEALMVLVPVAVVAWLLRAASRRADTMEAPDGERTTPPEI